MKLTVLQIIKIHSEKGKGFFIDPDFNNLEFETNIISKKAKTSMSPLERRNEIIKDLLINSQIHFLLIILLINFILVKVCYRLTKSTLPKILKIFILN